MTDWLIKSQSQSEIPLKERGELVQYRLLFHGMAVALVEPGYRRHDFGDGRTGGRDAAVAEGVVDEAARGLGVEALLRDDARSSSSSFFAATLTLKDPEYRKSPLRGYDYLLRQKNHLTDKLRTSDPTGEFGYYLELQESGALHLHGVWFPSVNADDTDQEIKRFRTNGSLTVCQLTHQVFNKPGGVMHAAIYASKGGSKSTVSEKEKALLSQLSKRRYFVPVAAAKFVGFVGSALKCSFELLREWRKNKGAPSQPALCLDSGDELENIVPKAPRDGEGANASSCQGGRSFKSAIVGVMRCLHEKCVSVVRVVSELFAQCFSMPLLISMPGQALRQSFLVFSWGEGIVWLPQPRAPPD